MIAITLLALLDTDNSPKGCNMSFDHLHPHATELFAITSGRVISYPKEVGLDSNGKQRVVRNEISRGMLTIYLHGWFFPHAGETGL